MELKASTIQLSLIQYPNEKRRCIGMKHSNNEMILSSSPDDTIDKLLKEIADKISIGPDWEFYGFTFLPNLSSQYINLLKITYMRIEQLFPAIWNCIYVRISKSLKASIITPRESSLKMIRYADGKIQHDYELLAKISTDYPQNIIPPSNFIYNKNYHSDFFSPRFSLVKQLGDFNAISKKYPIVQDGQKILSRKNQGDHIIDKHKIIFGKYTPTGSINFVLIRDLTLKFLDSESLKRFITLPIELSCSDLKLHFKFESLDDALDSLDLFKLIAILEGYNQNFADILTNDSMSIEIKLNCRCNDTLTNIDLPNLMYRNTHLVSLIIKDKLLSFSNESNFQNFFNQLEQLNMNELEKIELCDMKITQNQELAKLLQTLSKRKKLRYLKLENIRIELEDELKCWIEIGGTDGIVLFIDEKKSLENLTTLIITNTPIVKIGDICQGCRLYISKAIQIDQNSIIDFNINPNSYIDSNEITYPTEMITQNSQMTKIKINDSYVNFKKNGLVIPSTTTQLTIVNLQSTGLFTLESILNNSTNYFNLINLRIIKFKQCSFSTAEWLNNVMNKKFLPSIETIKLQEIDTIDTYTDLSFLSNYKLEQLIIDDSLIIFKGTENPNITSLEIKFSMLKENLNLKNYDSLYETSTSNLIYTDSKISETINSLWNIIKSSYIENLSFGNKSLIYLFAYGKDNTKNISSLENYFKQKRNLIFNSTECENPGEYTNYLQLFFSKPEIFHVDNIMFRNLNSLIDDSKALGKVEFQHFNSISFDYPSLKRQLFYNTNLCSFIELLKDSKSNEGEMKKEIDVIKERIMNLHDFLQLILKKNKKVIIYYDSKLHFNEIKIMLYLLINYSKVKAEIDNKKEDFIKDNFKADSTSVYGITSLLSKDIEQEIIRTFWTITFVEI